MSHDPSGIRLNYKYVAEKEDEDEENGDRGAEEVSHLMTDEDGGEPFVPSLIRIPRDDQVHDPSGIRLQYKHHKEEDGERERDTGGVRFLEPTLIRQLPPAEEHEREADITFSDADDGNNKKPAATADVLRVSDHDVSPRTVVRTFGEPVNREQFPLADSPTGGHLSKYKMKTMASKNSHDTAPPSALDAASLGDPWPMSSSITSLPGAPWATPERARIKNDTMDSAATTGNQSMLRSHSVSSPATEPPLPGSAQLKSPPVLSPSINVAAAAAPPTTTGPNNNNEDLMHGKASIRDQDTKDNGVPFGPTFKDQARGFNPIEEERIATDNQVPFGPEFKDQARGFNPIKAERIEDVDLHETSTGGPTFRHQTREEGSEEEIDTEASDATSADRGHDVISNGTTRLVVAELVIPVEAEVIEEKPPRRAWLVVFLALLLIGVIVGSILGSRPDPGQKGGESSSVEPPNARCDSATALELDGAAKIVRLSSMKSFMVGESVQACEYVPSPSDEQIGIWYTFETNMTRGVRISACTDSLSDDFDRNMLVFSKSCDQLDCLPKNYKDEGGPFRGCGREKPVIFQALRSTSYHVLVYGKKVPSGTEETFTLQAISRLVRPANDACEGAAALEIDGVWLDSSALNANGTVWFLLESKEGEITISTCSPANSFGHNIRVFSGNCSSLAPVASAIIEESLNCSGTLDSVQFISYVPATYRIEVEIVTDPSDAQTPNHDRVNETDFAIVARYRTKFGSTGCEGAIALEMGNFEAFRPADASTNTWVSCNISNPFNTIAAEVGWYRVIGNDTNYTVTTCGREDSLSVLSYSGSQINVYSGIECQNLTCGSLVGSHSSEETRCNYGVSWLAESGVQYWIQVLVFSDGGSFPVAVFPTPPNQECEDAIMLEAGEQTVNGTTLGALAGPKDSFCGTTADDADEDAGPSVWYSVTGTDEILTAFACSEFDSEILVYNGTCGNLACIDGNGDYGSSAICSSKYRFAAVSWFAEAGMVYHIKVTSVAGKSYSTAGRFELGIQIGEKENLFPPDATPSPAPPPENDNCESAKWVSQEPTGSTLDATPSAFLSDELIVCNGESFPSYHLSPDVWYQFNGTGEWHTATTCTGTESLDMFDSNLVIYSGTCSSLTCITSNDNSFSSNCYQNAIASWLTQEGETYLIRVSGTDEYGTGDFGIRIDDGKIELPPEPVNNDCETATLLELDQVVNGTTLGATPSREMPACDQGSNSPGAASRDVWYHLLGTGDILTVTTCTNTNLDDSGFDTYLGVYTGNCTSEMTCIAENDDDDRDSCSEYLLSGVSWQSELNEEYHVRVYGYGLTFGTFGVKAYRGTPDGKPPPDPDSTIPSY